ncbi:MAG: ABC transporter permease [Chloroflexi bacterium]|nr:ABC transporter permease [Chloroflexota bacterium]
MVVDERMAPPIRRRATGGAQRRRRPEPYITVATLGVILLAWYVISTSGWVPAYFVPTPQHTWQTFVKIMTEGYRGHSLFEHLLASLTRVLMAFGAAALLGVPLGLAIGSSTKIAAIFDWPIEFYRPLPPLAYYTLLVLWLGIDNASKVALLFLAALPPLVIATASGVRSVRSDYVNGARALGASRWQVFWHVIFPACLPEIFTGLRVSIGFTYTTLVAAEMVAGVNGIGWMVLDASKFLQSDVIFVGIILMGGTGALLDAIVRFFEHVVVPWHGKG